MRRGKQFRRIALGGKQLVQRVNRHELDAGLPVNLLFGY